MTRFNFPDHILRMILVPARTEDCDVLAGALADIVRQRTALHFERAAEGLEFYLFGPSEVVLQQAAEDIRRTTQLKLLTATPQAVTLAVPTRTVTVDYTHKRAMTGDAEFARLIFELRPSGNSSSQMAIHCASEILPERFHAAIGQGFASVLQAGVHGTEAVVGTRIDVTDAAFHEEDSTPLTFEKAARAALREAFSDSGFDILEPLCTVTVRTPMVHIGAIISDINLRRGTILLVGAPTPSTTVTALVPVATLIGYRDHLQETTNGTATFDQSYSHHEVVHFIGRPGPDRFPPAAALRA